MAEALPSDGQSLMSRRVLSPSEEQGQRDAKLGSNLSLRASLGSASDRQGCLCGILDHSGGPARSTTIKPISDVVPLSRVEHFFMDCGASATHSIVLANCQRGMCKKYEILKGKMTVDSESGAHMSMHPQAIPAIPEETARVARAVLPQGNTYMQMRDEFGTLYQDEDFQDLFPQRGQPAEAPWRLALVTVMHYAEGLTDRQAADAVRTRIDWKYTLSLELTDSGFDFSVLSEFRGRLLANGAERRLFDLLLEHCRKRGWIKARGKQRTDSSHVLAAIRTLRRLECVGETMRHALDVLAEVAPDWLLEHMDAEWAERYQKRFSDFRLPKDATERVTLAETIGADGRRLFERVYAETSLPWLRELDAVETLRRVWLQHYHASEFGTRFPRRWRTSTISPAHHFSLRRRSTLQSQEEHELDGAQGAFHPRRVRPTSRI